MTAFNPYLSHGNLVKPLLDMSAQIAAQGIEPSLQELIKIRASQLNGCAICLAMHAQEARAEGESELRIFLLDAWREASVYTPRERAALGWTEAMTALVGNHGIAAAREALAAEFSEEEQVKVTMLIATINAFNRLGAGFALSDKLAPKPQRKAA